MRGRGLRRIVFLLAFLWSTGASAQYSDSVFYYAGLTSTATFNKTTGSSSYLINNGVKLGTKKKDVTINSNNRWLYGRQDEGLTNNDFSSVWDLNLYKTFPHFYYWGLLNYNSTYSLKINNQLQAGIGVAYNFFDKKEFTLNVSDGIIYDYSDLILEEGVREVYGTPRNSFRLQIKCNLKDKLVFSGTGFLQNSLQDLDDYIIKSDLSLSVKLKKWLSITSAYSFNQMTRTHTESWLLTYGITLENYF